MTTRTDLLNTRYAEISNRIESYKAAETVILGGAQSYSIGNRTLTRADLNSIQKQITRLEKEQLRLINSGAIRIQRVVPRDI